MMKLFLSLMVINSVNSQLIRLCPQPSPQNPNICENGGTCIVRNDRDISCVCPENFTGFITKFIKFYLFSKIFNFIS